MRQGFENVEGVDVAPRLLSRAENEQPGTQFTVLTNPPQLDQQEDSVDLVLLFAVLTCIPGDAGQRELVTELRRVLRPGGLLYVSDLCLQEDHRNRSRYQQFAAKYGTYGSSRPATGWCAGTTPPTGWTNSSAISTSSPAARSQWRR